MVRCRRAWVVLVLGCSFAAVAGAAGCSNRGDKLQESRRLIAEGTAMRDAGWKSGDQKSFEKGQKMIDKGERLREEAFEGT